MIDPTHSVAGLLVGLLVGLTGVGGGSLMTPVLVLVFGFAPKAAVGTDLLFAAATKSVGTGVHGLKGSVDWRIVRRLATGSLPATIVTLLVLSVVDDGVDNTSQAISLVLGGVLVLTSIGVFARDRIVRWLAPRTDRLTDRRVALITVCVGAVLGTLVSLTSVGAGALGMTVLLVLYNRAPVSRLVGSDIAHAVPLTLAAGIGHWWIGSINLGLLASLLVGSVPGVIAGSLLASRVPERTLTLALAAVLGLVGVKLLL